MNVIFIVGDGLRVKNLSCYGNPKNTTLTIDRLAREGVLFEDAYACSDHTDPSFTTMLSGKYPLSHGITRHGTRSHGATKEQIRIFNRTTVLLPEILKPRGYYNMAFDWLGRWHRRGYDFYGETEDGEIKNKRSDYIDLASKFIREKRDEDFFMLFHCWDTHTPFLTLPPAFVDKFRKGGGGERVEDMLQRIGNEKWREIAGNYHLQGIEYVDEIPAMYDAAANFFDHLVNRLLECLEECEILDDTIIVLTGDHGDNVLRGGVFVGHFGLYDSVIHVPLILWGPGLPRGKRVEGFVQHVDLVPTILELLGIEFDGSNLDGNSLLPLIRGEKKSIRSAVLAQAAAARERYAIRTSDYKYIWSPTAHECLHDFDPVDSKYRVELYDLNEDPGETKNIVEARPSLEEELRKRLLAWVNELKSKREKQMRESEIRRIKEKISGLKKEGKKGF